MDFRYQITRKATDTEEVKERNHREKIIVKYDKETKKETMVWVKETKAKLCTFNEIENQSETKKYYKHDEKTGLITLIDDSKFV